MKKRPTSALSSRGHPRRPAQVKSLNPAREFFGAGRNRRVFPTYRLTRALGALYQPQANWPDYLSKNFQ